MSSSSASGDPPAGPGRVPFDLGAPDFLDPGALDREARRIFDICHGCRLCLSFCPSFPALFDAIDGHEERGEGEVAALTQPEIDRVVDLCYQCKLCFVNCPYTPPHEWAVDFPRVVLRAKAVRAKQHGVTRQDRFLGDPDRLGRLASHLPGVMNWANRQGALRQAMQRAVGVDHRRNLPPFVRPTFADWATKHRGPAPAAEAVDPARAVVLYGTCLGNYNYPDINLAALQVLEAAGKQVVHLYPRCCGMPMLDGGDIDGAVRNARENVRAIAPYVRRGVPVVVPQPTCGYVFKQELPFLVPDDDGRRVAGATLDLLEYVDRLLATGALKKEFPGPGPGRVAYHLPCHLKAQNIGTRSAAVLRQIPGAEVQVIDKCSAFDGTWGMKQEYFDLSIKYASKLVRGVTEAAPQTVCSDCSLAGLNVEYGTGHRPVHPIQVLRDALGLVPPFRWNAR
ncbi:MAG TPA: heterodisulfide reductase-related iron-sulfur binding cluster [Polyangia bacterium]|jgi:Fe-S oxidoreductase